MATDGSQTQPPERWKHDVMELGRSGRLVEFNLADGSARERAAGLAYAFGVGAVGDDAAWVCESWRHRVVQIGGAQAGRAVVDGLPGYPSRIAPAAGGGWWLTCFTLRTQLVEFVLREPAFRKRMLKEIDPRYWIAPALTSGNTYLEPMQGAHLKTMGVVKPWAPPRSYGLVIRLDEQGLIRYSLHSRFDGKHHGIVAAVERDGWLYLLVQGPRAGCCGCRSPTRKRAWRLHEHSTTAILALKKATKKYAGVPAIEDVDFELLPGEVHAIVGENGAGKSTLTKVMAGVVNLTSGEMLSRVAASTRARPPRRANSASRWCSRRPAWCRR